MGILCPDSTPGLLNIFDLSLAPQLFYYTYVPVLFIFLFIGIYALIKDNFSLLSILLFSVVISFSLWVVNSFFAWMAAYANHVMLAWVVNPVFEIFIFFCSFYLAYVFINGGKVDVSFRIKEIMLVICLPILFFLPTKYNIKYLDFSICEGVPGSMWYYYMYVIEIFTLISIIVLSVRKYKNLGKNNNDRNKIIYFTFGVVSFLLLFIGSNIIGQITLIQQISFVGSVGAVLFIGFLTYLIVKYQTFNIKIFGVQALVFAIIIITASQIFLVQTLANRILTAITLIFVSIFGYFLIRSASTEIKRREEIASLAASLEKSNQTLEALNRERAELLSFTADQLKTNQQSLRGATSPFIQSVIKNNERLIKISESFNDLAALEKDGVKLEYKDTDINEMVSETIAENSSLFKDKAISIELEKSRTVKPVPVDTKKLKSVLIRLLDNAVKYSSANTSIRVIVRSDYEGAAVWVKDEGIGFGRGEWDDLYGKYYRSRQAAALHPDGIGLSLFLCKKIVEAHHGRVLAHSYGLKDGAEFGFWVPYINS